MSVCIGVSLGNLADRPSPDPRDEKDREWRKNPVIFPPRAICNSPSTLRVAIKEPVVLASDELEPTERPVGRAVANSPITREYDRGEAAREEETEVRPR